MEKMSEADLRLAIKEFKSLRSQTSVSEFRDSCIELLLEDDSRFERSTPIPPEYRKNFRRNARLFSFKQRISLSFPSSNILKSKSSHNTESGISFWAELTKDEALRDKLKLCSTDDSAFRDYSLFIPDFTEKEHPTPLLHANVKNGKSSLIRIPILLQLERRCTVSFTRSRLHLVTGCALETNLSSSESAFSEPREAPSVKLSLYHTPQLPRPHLLATLNELFVNVVIERARRDVYCTTGTRYQRDLRTTWYGDLPSELDDFLEHGGYLIRLSGDSVEILELLTGLLLTGDGDVTDTVNENSYLNEFLFHEAT